MWSALQMGTPLRNSHEWPPSSNETRPIATFASTPPFSGNCEIKKRPCLGTSNADVRPCSSVVEVADHAHQVSRANPLPHVAVVGQCVSPTCYSGSRARKFGPQRKKTSKFLRPQLTTGRPRRRIDPRIRAYLQRNETQTRAPQKQTRAHPARDAPVPAFQPKARNRQRAALRSLFAAFFLLAFFFVAFFQLLFELRPLLGLDFIALLALDLKLFFSAQQFDEC